LPKGHRYQCAEIPLIIWSRAIIKVLKAGEFDKVVGTVNNVLQDYRVPLTGMPLRSLKLGDWANFDNDPTYGPPIHKSRWWFNENVIKTGSDMYFGFPMGEKSHLGWREKLLEKYNTGIHFWQYTWLGRVPGYEGEAYSLNIPKLAQGVFDERTRH
jgi:hypothetical protein